MCSWGGLRGTKYVGLIAAILFLREFPIFKYSDFATVLTVPAFVLGLYIFMEKKDMKSAALAGVLMGLMGLSNTQAFFVGMILFGLTAFYMLYPNLKEKGWKLEMLKEEKPPVVGLAVLFAIGFALSLLFWFKPIFVFRGQTPNDIQNITYPDITRPEIFFDQTYSLMMGLLIPFGFGFPGIIFPALNLAGIYFMFRNPGKYWVVLVVFLTGLIGILHPILTLPLLKMQLMSSMMYGRVSILSAVLLIGVALVNLMEKLKSRNTQLGALALCMIFAGVFVSDTLAARSTDRWATVGKQELPEQYMELESWIKGNTNVNDVFLTTNEDGFMMNALTGRKVVSYRRAHSSPYTDMHARMADQAVMVYGTNVVKTAELLNKYDVKYLLITYNWVRNEFQINEQGQLVGFFDPLDVPNNATNKVYRDQNGVKYIEVTMSMDPAPPPNVPLYDLIVALPYPIDKGGPVNPTLMGNFRLVKTVYSDGYPVFQIYERVD